jgi:Domain of unknown function (DUF5664)
MENTDKVVDGVTYERVPITLLRGQMSCVGCAHNTDPNGDLCNNLATEDCAKEYIWQVKDVTKSSVQGVKYDDGKTLYSLVPPYALEAVAKNLTAGLKKYPERNNWKQVEKAEERYLDALYRHLEAHRRGEIYDTDNIDPTTTHLSAVAVNTMFLLELLLNPELKGKN